MASVFRQGTSPYHLLAGEFAGLVHVNNDVVIRFGDMDSVFLDSGVP
ncbi:MAG TPA: hypothetical protein VFJ28_03675 [Marmoricola sp.]|nr:hypothetical protein [Marmoricola sp.]